MTDMEEDMETGPVTDEGQEQREESWKEETPPDDFHDHEQDDLESMETGETEESSPATDPIAQAKKSGNRIMLVTLAAIGLVIGGLAYIQFSGGEQPKGPIAMPADVLTSGAPSQAAPTAPTPPNPEYTGLPTTPTTAELDIATIYDAGKDKTVSPTDNAVAIPGMSAPDPAAEKTKMGQASTSEIQTTTPITPPSSTAPALQVMSDGVAGQAPAPTETKPAKTDSNAAALIAMPAQAPAPSAEARINELSAQIEELKKALQDVTRQTTQIVQRLDAMQGTTPLSGVGLESRPEQPEQKSASEAGKKTEKAAPKEVISSLYVADEEMETKQPVKKAAKPAAKKVQKTAKTAPAKEKTGAWVLRAATPDAAWISKGDSAAELQQIQVGDTLPGIGKVREIRQTGDKWTVVGTKGTIH